MNSMTDLEKLKLETATRVVVAWLESPASFARGDGPLKDIVVKSQEIVLNLLKR